MGSRNKPSRVAQYARKADAVVHVGIPVYRRTTFLTEAIESVLRQTATCWQLTVLEDGPADSSVGKLVEPYLADPRIRSCPAGRLIGVGANWSRAIGLTSAPYVAVLHDDDLWRADFLRHRIDFLERHPECGFVFSATNRIDHLGREVGVWRPPLQEGVYRPAEIAPLLLRRNLVGATQTVLTRRSAFEAVGPFDDDFPHCDYEMWVRLALRFPVGYLDIADADYRVHENSTTHTIRPQGSRIVALADHFIRLADTEQPGLLTRAERRRVKSDVLLSALSFDALTPGDRRYATYLLSRAVREHPRALVDSRALDWLRILVGPKVRGALGTVQRSIARRVRMLRGGQQGRNAA